jgi:hypothetical protein
MDSGLTFTLRNQLPVTHVTRRGEQLIFTCKGPVHAKNVADSLKTALLASVAVNSRGIDQLPQIFSERCGVKVKPITPAIAVRVLSEIPAICALIANTEPGRTSAPTGLAKAEMTQAIHALGFMSARITLLKVMAAEEFARGLDPSARIIVD